MKTTYKPTWWSIIKIGGAWVSFCIGSGFATGQELLQYFATYGIFGFGGIVIAMLLHGYATSAFLGLGVDQKFDRAIDAFDYYCGPLFGKVFRWLSVIMMFLSPVVMIAGFGAAVNQYFGVPLFVGTVIMGLACGLTVLLGLYKMVDILGVIGPIIIIITLLTGGIWLAGHMDSISAGAQLAPAMGGLKIGRNWVESGVMYAAWAPMASLPFLVSCATTVKSRKDAVLGGILGTVFYGFACVMMLAAFFSDYANVRLQSIPTLYLANNISTILGYAFLVVIFLGIYSSATPGLFNFCSAFYKEGNIKYYIFAIVVTIAATAVAIWVPFGTLLNSVYSFYGYLGVLLFLLIVVKQFRVYHAKKNMRKDNELAKDQHKN